MKDVNVLDTKNEPLEFYQRMKREKEEFEKRRIESLSAQESATLLQRNNVCAGIISDLCPLVLEKQVERISLGLTPFEDSRIMNEYTFAGKVEQVGWKICDIFAQSDDSHISSLSIFLSQSGNLSITRKDIQGTVIGYVDLRPLKLGAYELDVSRYRDISYTARRSDLAGPNHLYPEKLYYICNNLIAIAYAYKIDTTEYEKRLLSAYQPE